MLFERLLSAFVPLLTVFEPFFDPIVGYIGPFWDYFEGAKLDHFGVILECFWSILVDPAPFWGRLGIILALFWHHCWCVYDPFRKFWGALG